MSVTNIVEKFGTDGYLDRSWDLPAEVIEPLRAHVEVTPAGWVVNAWPMTAQLASIVQPWIDEPIDVLSSDWFVSSAQSASAEASATESDRQLPATGRRPLNRAGQTDDNGP
ncbi:hypothetical protein O7598_02780 [Micromonospora sp. WMMC241]|uniref:hypothetical protein n=1 Tax=Micromonospora sp. WMMC241 TaxID=3015159 RepID=UPI0022B609E7|nr:hypothetical protein [Micromonospora sp. WMMC241]MCZ7435308.1 hypothetical protein [Micromonospora sp. WMMC241]